MNARRALQSSRKGWCPGALRPMESGDGLIVRIRLHAGRGSPEMFAALAELSQRFGNCLIDLTQRAGLQMRGVRADTHEALLQALDQLGLLDANAEQEALRNIITDPLGGLSLNTSDVAELSRALEDALADARDLETLPAKFGFAICAGVASPLARASADIRLFVEADGAVFIAPDGADQMMRVDATDALEAALVMARAFLAQPAVANGSVRRMRGLVAAHGTTWLFPPSADLVACPKPDAAPQPGLIETEEGARGAIIGLPFGSLPAVTLEALANRAAASGVHALRITPWRSLIVPGVDSRFLAEIGDLDVITRPGDPLMLIDACTGAPACDSASVETRVLARAIASRHGDALDGLGSIHISGCAKGCARKAAADIVLTGREGKFDLVLQGRPTDPPAAPSLDGAAVLANPIWTPDAVNKNFR